ncbi:MAG TPA: hypothetical protein VH678_03995 [Xanthobacteraceae bacterium]|jgi:hypothetical protein
MSAIKNIVFTHAPQTFYAEIHHENFGEYNTMKITDLADEKLWRAMSDTSDAMSGLAKLYIIFPSPHDVSRRIEKDARLQLLEHLMVLDKLRSRFDDYFFELERRYSHEWEEEDPG